jgi:integrase
MARIQKRVTAKGTTTYVAKWRTPDGTDRSRGGFTTKKAASDYAKNAESAASQGLVFDPAKGKMLFRDAAAIWLESRTADTRNNAANHRYALAPASTRRGDGKTLGIDAVFGGYPLNKITREYIQAWVNSLIAAGKKPSTVRHAFWTVRMVLEQATADGRLARSPADHVKLPTEHSSKGGKVGVVDDPKQFLTALQVSALESATPWPYDTLVHVAAWSGLRAGELDGLTVGAVELPDPPLNPNAPAKPGVLRVEKAARPNGGVVKYGPLKTEQSYRRVPLTPATTERLRAYLAAHPRRHEPDAPLWPGMTLTRPRPRPTGVCADAAEPGAKPSAQATAPSADANARARRQAERLAELTVAGAEARLVLDWMTPLRHPTFYKAVFRPAVLRANRLSRTAKLEPAQSFHSLRHSYASLSIAAGIKPAKLSGRMGHANIRTTLDVYVHLFPDDDATEDMAALGALAAPKPNYTGNVVPLHG